MLDRETITHPENKSPTPFSCSVDSFIDCLERTKKILKTECNGDFEHYENCVNRAMDLLN